MQRFFTKQETQLISRPGGKALSCMTCGLFHDCKSPRMAPYGNFRKKILNIGEAPGEWEDRNGKPWQGKTGRHLQATMKKFGVDLFDDCLNINAVSCRPMEDGENRTPTSNEIDSCRKFVLKCIDQYKPKMIILFGSVSVSSLIGYRWKKELGGITKWRGFTIPDRDFGCWVCPTMHPSFVERGGKVEQTIWEDDLKLFLGLVNTPLFVYNEPEIEIIEDLAVIEKIKGEAAIDYETPAIKPHTAGYKIVSAAVADTLDHTYAFLMPTVRGKQRPFLNFLANKEVGKIAHNMKFEQSWSVNCLNQTVENWVWDTMIASHVIDNRDGITGLKFQVYTSFGIVDYSSQVEEYLKGGDRKDGNAPNRIYELLKQPGGRELLLHYNGLDTIYTKRLSQIQRTDIQLPF